MPETPSDQPSVPDEEAQFPARSVLSPVHDFEVDLSSFLPEGSSLEEHSEPEPAPEPVDLAVLTQIESDLAAVDRALTALDDDSYGRCDACGEPIEAERLQANPVGRQCGRHLEPVSS